MNQLVPLLAVIALAILCLPLAGIRRPGLQVYRLGLRLLLLGLIVGGGFLVMRPDLFMPFWEEWPANFGGLAPVMNSPAAGAWLAVMAGLILLPVIWLLDEVASRTSQAVAQPAQALPPTGKAEPRSDGVRATDIRSASASMTKAGLASGRPNRIADYV